MLTLFFAKTRKRWALLLNGKKKDVKLRDFKELGVVLNIPEKVRHNTYQKFKAYDLEVYRLINSSFLSSE